MTNTNSSVATAVAEEVRSQPQPQAPTGHQVVCVCGGFGYPHGTAGSPRITMVGRALQEAGMGLSVLHCGPSPYPVNTQRKGVHEGIRFEYTTAVKRPSNSMMRVLAYLLAFVGLTVRLFQLFPHRRRTAVWNYIPEGPGNLYVSTLCRLLGIPLVLELCEWWPSEVRCDAFTKWMHKGPMFAHPTGVLVISKLLGQRAQEVCARVNPNVLIHRLPAIVDSDHFIDQPASQEKRRTLSDWFVWCGGEDWMIDVLFLVRVAALVRARGHRCPIKIVGRFTPASRQRVADYLADKGIPSEDFVFAGYVSAEELADSFRTARALLLPLRDNDRSRTRLPNKLPEYLAAGRPVVTCAVGDLTEFLVHRESAYLAAPDEEESFAAQLLDIMNNPAAATAIGDAGQQACLQYLDFRVQADSLAAWFQECIARKR